MRETQPRFEAHGVRLVCVVQGTAEEAARFCALHGLGDRCLPDPDRASYRAMGFARTSWKDLVFASPALKARRRQNRAAGFRVSLRGTFRGHSDIRQLPGAALIARGGTVLWLHRGEHPGDLPPAAELLRVVETRLNS